MGNYNYNDERDAIEEAFERGEMSLKEYEHFMHQVDMDEDGDYDNDTFEDFM